MLRLRQSRPERGLLFIAHLGASEVIEVDIRTRQVVRTIPNLSQARRPRRPRAAPGLRHRHRRQPPGHPRRGHRRRDRAGPHRGLSGRDRLPPETRDGVDHQRIRRIRTGGRRHHRTGARHRRPRRRRRQHRLHPVANQILVAVQGKGDLAAIAPETLDVARRLPTPGCLGFGFGFGFGSSARLAFVACADNATLLTIDLAIWQTAGTTAVGEHQMSSPTTKASKAFTSPPRTASSACSTNATGISPMSGPGTSPTAPMSWSSTRASATPTTRIAPGPTATQPCSSRHPAPDPTPPPDPKVWRTARGSVAALSGK